MSYLSFTFPKLLVAFVFSFITTVSVAQLPSGFNQTLVQSGLDPTNMTIAPDGRIFITEKRGIIKVIKNGILLDEPFLTIQVDNSGERGLQEITFHPDFVENQIFYIYYTAPGEYVNKVSRFVASGDVGIPESETVIFQSGTLPANIHNGGSMLFGNDNKLYIATGDGGWHAFSQSFESLNGKVIRLNDDGSIPTDNPFYNELSGSFRSIYALGFRNPYQMVKNPLSGEIYVNDVGGESWEEINELKPGRNYGWGVHEGYSSTSTLLNYENPVFAYDHNFGCAITGGVFYNPLISQFPPDYEGKYFFADYCNGRISVFDPADSSVAEFAAGFDYPLDLIVSEDGALYCLTRNYYDLDPRQMNGQLWKINFTGIETPSIAIHPESQTVSNGGSVTFSVLANGAKPLSYRWQQNGTDIPGATENSLTINEVSEELDGAEFRVIVSNSFSSDTSNVAILVISDNTLPVATINSPLPDDKYKAGQIIHFSGQGTDAEDGLIAPEKMTWRIDLHHDSHSHPAMDPVSGITSGTFEIPVSGETSDNVWYRIYLTVEDSEGFRSTTFTEVYPHKSYIVLKTIPDGLWISLDGKPQLTPFGFTGVQGIERTISTVNTQRLDEELYKFSHWEHGGEISQIISTPEKDSVFTAVFSIVTSTVPDNNDRISVFPNPATDLIYFDLSAFSTSGSVTITLVDTHSNIVYQEVLERYSDLYMLNCKGFSPGVYFASLKSNDKVFTGKVLIKN